MQCHTHTHTEYCAEVTHTVLNEGFLYITAKNCVENLSITAAKIDQGVIKWAAE